MGSDDPVHALRAEAAELPLPVETALPLVMVAAGLGELELLTDQPRAEVHKMP